MNHRFYITESMPNGTCDLIITDADGVIVNSLDGAIFWPTTMRNPAFLALCDGESVWGTGRDIGDTDELSDSMLVWQIDKDDALRFVAVSPCNDGEQIAKAIKERE